MAEPKGYFGCQVWVEPHESAARVDLLFARLADAGLGWARLFLMWPWIEEQPGAWDFGVFDMCFDAAARHGVRIKATLTANSGPWHIGTPSVLHSHTGFLRAEQRAPMRRYIEQCVSRYAGHPGLGQWILWNEPTGGRERTPESLQSWQHWLGGSYGTIEALNRRWRTGYADFAAVPFPEEIPHPMHQGSFWNSYRPWLDDYRHRAAWLNSELQWIASEVRRLDPETDLCVNPTSILSNQAADGTDIEGMGRIVNVIGASYHPAWHFTYADRQDFPALMVAGVRLEAVYPTVGRVEVTEVQSGNTLNSSHMPRSVSPGELARFYLAGLAAGAESVTGWLLNVRSIDFEAGDWGLLDNRDEPSARSRMLRRLHDRLDAAATRTGPWSAAPTTAWLPYDLAAQAIEAVEAAGAQVPGRLGGDSAHGLALLAAQALRAGLTPTPVRLDLLPNRPARPGELVIVSHLVAWEEADAARLLDFAHAGGVLLIDATSGRKTADAALHRPWPGLLAERLGFYVADLESRPEGYGLLLDGLPAGRWLLARAQFHLDADAGWRAWPELRFDGDGAPCVFERAYGAGRVLAARGLLGPSLVHAPECAAAVRYLVGGAGAAVRSPLRLVAGHPAAFALPVQAAHGSLTALFAPDTLDRSGRPIVLQAPAGRYVDLFDESDYTVGAGGELALHMPDGVALLWQEQ